MIRMGAWLGARTAAADPTAVASQEAALRAPDKFHRMSRHATCTSEFLGASGVSMESAKSLQHVVAAG